MQETKKIDQKLFLNINGVRQGMFLKGADIHNPVLLYLHGGPGSPEIAFDSDTPSALDQMFMVCWWEQRGAGISYSKKIPAESMCINQLVDDAIAVADYLWERFKKEKIYLLGHSWGSLLGIQVIQKAPERFYAYMGVGQVAWQLRSEQLAYDYMLEKFQLVNDNAMIKKLKKYDRDTCAYEIKYLICCRKQFFCQILPAGFCTENRYGQFSHQIENSDLCISWYFRLSSFICDCKTVFTEHGCAPEGILYI